MNVALVGQRIDRVRDLAGFKRSHRVPDEVNDFTKAFVARIAADQIDANLGKIYDELRVQFRFKRKDLDVSISADGRGSITTPFFQYSVTISLSSSDPSQVIWRHQVSEISEAGHIIADAFARVFGCLFDTVELATAGTVDVEALIDRIEELNNQRISLAYDQQATWCRISIEGIAGELEITPRALSLVHRSSSSPGHLLQSFLEFQKALVETCHVKLNAFDDRTRSTIS